jgi:hypothetical protein
LPQSSRVKVTVDAGGASAVPSQQQDRINRILIP